MGGLIKPEDRTLAEELLTGIGLGEKMQKYPHQLSGGERQLTAIDRAFIAKQVKARKKAAIMVTHDERMLTYCDRVYRIEDGVLSQDR